MLASTDCSPPYRPCPRPLQENTSAPNGGSEALKPMRVLLRRSRLWARQCSVRSSREPAASRTF
eukprot:1183820-Prorocentrum_minimum.AAC.2